MKAVNNNGKIKVYASVPDSFHSSTGVHMNATKMSAEKLKNAGMFDVLISDDYDERIHTLGEIYFDSPNTVFKKDFGGLSGTTLFLDLDVVIVGGLDVFFSQPGNFLIAHDKKNLKKRKLTIQY